MPPRKRPHSELESSVDTWHIPPKPKNLSQLYLPGAQAATKSVYLLLRHEVVLACGLSAWDICSLILHGALTVSQENHSLPSLFS